MSKTKTAALGLTPNAARENPDPTAKLDRNGSPHDSKARRWRSPFPCRNLRALVRDGLLEMFVDLGCAPATKTPAALDRQGAS
jgi:hypothetical protein